MSAYAKLMLTGWTEAQKPRAPAMNTAPAFYRNLEQHLDLRRKEHALLTAKPRWPDDVVDLTSGDFLSLSRSGRIREALLDEFRRLGDFRLSASGSRVQYGNYDYLNEVEKEIALFHGAEAAYICHSCFLANVVVLSAIPLPGDVILYDEFCHASMHEGMTLSQATQKISFLHNDVDSLRKTLALVKESNAALVSGTRSVLICVESVYSMDGDMCPLVEFVQATKEAFPLGNAQFLVDEAHGTGVIGPRGTGLVSLLGLEKEIAIRVHGCSKALGSTGGVIFANQTIRSALLNHAKFLIYSGSPSFPMVASIRVGYQLLSSGSTQDAQDTIQRLVKHFFTSITSNPIWDEATDEGIFSIPLVEDWESRQVQTHIVPVLTRPGYETFLSFHLGLLANMNAYSIAFPIVPKNKTRVRLVFHAHNTMEQVDALATAICDWAQEMLDIEQGNNDSSLPRAARQVYAL